MKLLIYIYSEEDLENIENIKKDSISYLKFFGLEIKDVIIVNAKEHNDNILSDEDIEFHLNANRNIIKLRRETDCYVDYENGKTTFEGIDPDSLTILDVINKLKIRILNTEGNQQKRKINIAINILEEEFDV